MYRKTAKNSQESKQCMSQTETQNANDYLEGDWAWGMLCSRWRSIERNGLSSEAMWPRRNKYIYITSRVQCIMLGIITVSSQRSVIGSFEYETPRS